MLSRRIILYSLLIILSLPALTQSTDRNAYTVANGLTNDHITCMLQDAQGFLWVGTFNGLSRFDGTHFYNFQQGLLQSNQIAGDLILDMQEEGDHMWIGHRFGLSKINKNNLTCENFQPPDTGSTYTLLRAVRDIWMDKQGELWLAGIHLFKFDRQTNTIIKMVDLAKLRPREQPNH
jgi:ligand-binding sensor domain-containing protein